MRSQVGLNLLQHEALLPRRNQRRQSPSNAPPQIPLNPVSPQQDRQPADPPSGPQQDPLHGQLNPVSQPLNPRRHLKDPLHAPPPGQRQLRNLHRRPPNPLPLNAARNQRRLRVHNPDNLPLNRRHHRLSPSQRRVQKTGRLREPGQLTHLRPRSVPRRSLSAKLRLHRTRTKRNHQKTSHN